MQETIQKEKIIFQNKAKQKEKALKYSGHN
jgi:hypothetical protein